MSRRSQSPSVTESRLFIRGLNQCGPVIVVKLLCKAVDHHKLQCRALKMRYHPERNFNKIGRTMMPINQDAAVQYIGFMGELTMVNPLAMAKLYDSNPAA